MPKRGALATETKLEVDYLGGTQRTACPTTRCRAITLANLRAERPEFYAGRGAFRGTHRLDAVEAGAARRACATCSTTRGARTRARPTWETSRGSCRRPGFSTVCWVPGTPGHSWQATAAGGTTIGRKGMLLAAKVLAATAYDLYTNPEAIAAAKDEHARRVGKDGYQSLLVPGQKPPLDYRKAPVAQAWRSKAQESLRQIVSTIVQCGAHVASTLIDLVGARVIS